MIIERQEMHIHGGIEEQEEELIFTGELAINSQLELTLAPGEYHLVEVVKLEHMKQPDSRPTRYD